MPVWIAGTEANLELAKDVRETPGTYVTTFDVTQPIRPIDLAIGYRDMLELHHPEMTHLYVCGLPVTGELDSRWSEAGLALISYKDGVAVFECGEYDLE